MTDWQPIETAPQKSGPVLGYGMWAGEINGEARLPCILVVSRWHPGNSGDYAGYDWDVCGTDADAAWFKPTHWMPLPAAPTIGDRHD